MGMAVSPSLVLSFLLASLYGAVFHFVWGKRWRDLAVYWMVAVVGFAIGQVLFGFLGFSIYLAGEVRVVESTIMSWICLFVARWLNV
ncbi:MAG: hypothetical protein OEV76_00575 [Anaerolineae bacterium]|nr:hypothetical protein [Anaerolineae bacterium]